MPIVFKYKHNNCDSFAPGFTKGSGRGADGDVGESGNTLFFLDTEISDSYSMNLILEKIQNNYTVSGANIDMSARPYKTGDLFCSPQGEYYKLEYIDNAPVLEFLGKTRNVQSLPKVYTVCIHNVTNQLGSLCKGFAVSNRNIDIMYKSYKTNPKVTQQQWCEKEGIWIVIHIPGLTENYPILSVSFPQRKRLDLIAPPSAQYDDTSGVPFLWQYERTLEFTNIYTEEEFPEDVSSIDKKFLYFISSDLLDEFHLYGNNLKCTLNNNATGYYKYNPNKDKGININLCAQIWYENFLQSSDSPNGGNFVDFSGLIKDGNIDSNILTELIVTPRKEELYAGNSIFVSRQTDIPNVISNMFKDKDTKYSLLVTTNDHEIMQKQIEVIHK